MAHRNVGILPHHNTASLEDGGSMAIRNVGILPRHNPEYVDLILHSRENVTPRIPLLCPPCHAMLTEAQLQLCCPLFATFAS
jgi:hypothetical protein